MAGLERRVSALEAFARNERRRSWWAAAKQYGLDLDSFTPDELEMFWELHRLCEQQASIGTITAYLAARVGVSVEEFEAAALAT
jgi:hypothetical protein